MHEVEESLAHTVVEHCPQKPERTTGVSKPVTMSEVENLIVNFCRDGFPVNDKTTLLLQVSISPDIVIACEEMDLYAHISKLGQFPQKARKPLWHNIAVLVPEVEHVAQQVYCRSLVLYGVQKSDQPSLLCPAVLYGERAKMSIAEEIYVFTHRYNSLLMTIYIMYNNTAKRPLWLSLPVYAHFILQVHELLKAQFHPCLFGHHALVPCRFEDEVHVARLYALNTLHLGTDVL